MEGWMSRVGASIAIVAALLFVGCGGGESTGAEAESGGKPLTPSAYAARAEAICRKAEDQRRQKVQRLVQEHPSDSVDQKQAAELMAETTRPVYQNMIAELAELDFPSGKKGRKYREWVEAFEELLEEALAEPHGLLEPPVAVHHLAKDAGLVACWRF